MVKQYLNIISYEFPGLWYNDEFSSDGRCNISFHYPKVQKVDIHQVGLCQRDIFVSKPLKQFMIPTNAATLPIICWR